MQWTRRVLDEAPATSFFALRQMKVPLRIALFLALLANPSFVPAQTASLDQFTATCVDARSHHDGDTFTCLTESVTHRSIRVRFAGIDAPETGQAYWRASRDKLRQLATPGSTVDCYKQDRWGRFVCRLKTAQGRDAADDMLLAGLAWHSVKYADEQSPKERERYTALEAEARAAMKGLWHEPWPQPPWECRAVRRKGEHCR